jgi:bacteriocin biosynthesis cyclodehydratase domain-containing protein
MVLKMDPAFAVVWRDPLSLQVGVDPARAVLREVSGAEERLISALEAGVSRSGLSMIGTANGLGEKDIDRLLDRLGAVLLQSPEPAAERRVSIVGAGPSVERIADALAISGVRVAVGASVPAENGEVGCDLGISVGSYVLDPASYGYWLRRDLPHLSVIFGDDSVTIGPLVEPGATACLYCLEHYRRDADASWPAIASQLWGRRARSETPLTSIEVAARVARLVLRRLDGERATAATSVRLDASTGEVAIRTWLPHPDCGCIGLQGERRGEPGPPSAGLPGTDSAPGSGRPTTVAGAVVPA